MTDYARSCPPRLSYYEEFLAAPQAIHAEGWLEPAQEALISPPVQITGIHCHICDTQWPDLLQWQEHLSHGVHRRAQVIQSMVTTTSFLAYCSECAFYYHDSRSYMLHFGLHQTLPNQESTSFNALRPLIPPATMDSPRADLASLSAVSTVVSPDLHSRIQAEPALCGTCSEQLVGLAQVMTHLEAPAHQLSSRNRYAGDALFCPFCKYWLNGLAQWESHISMSPHRHKRKQDKELRRTLTTVGIGFDDWPYAD